MLRSVKGFSIWPPSILFIVVYCLFLCYFQLAPTIYGAKVAKGKGAVVSTIKCQNVLDKLEAYAKGQVSVSGLTIQELKEAHEEYETWDKFTKNHVKSRQPLFRLLSDFLLVPMERFDDLIGYDLDDDTDDDDEGTSHDMYIRRLEDKYKYFRPGYLGNMIGSEYSRALKIDTLIYSFMGLDPLQQPLTVKMLHKAYEEYKSYEARLEQIGIHEDIYSCLFELKHSMNLLNRVDVQILAKKIFTLIDDVHSDKDMNLLRDIFVDEMAKNGLVAEDGQLTRIISPSALLKSAQKNGSPIVKAPANLQVHPKQQH